MENPNFVSMIIRIICDGKSECATSENPNVAGGKIRISGGCVFGFLTDASYL